MVPLEVEWTLGTFSFLIIYLLRIYLLCNLLKVSVQGVVALVIHFVTLCQELDFYEADFFFIINFQKEKAVTLTLLIILIVKSLQVELHGTNLLL